METQRSTETLPQDLVFNLFAELPPEVRLTIWEAALPEEIHHWSKVCEIWDLNRGEDKIVTSPRAKVYMKFLRCCHESRHLALRNGSPVPLKSLEPDNGPPKKVWIGSKVEMVFLPFEPRYLDRITTLPPNVKTLADTIGNSYDHTRVATVGKYITRWRGEVAIVIDTLYFGLVKEIPIDYKESGDGLRVCVNSPRFGGVRMIWPRESVPRPMRTTEDSEILELDAVFWMMNGQYDFL